MWGTRHLLAFVLDSRFDFGWTSSGCSRFRKPFPSRLPWHSTWTRRRSLAFRLLDDIPCEQARRWLRWSSRLRCVYEHGESRRRPIGLHELIPPERRLDTAFHRGNKWSLAQVPHIPAPELSVRVSAWRTFSRRRSYVSVGSSRHGLSWIASIDRTLPNTPG